MTEPRVQLLYVDAPDVRAVVLGNGGKKLEGSVSEAVSGSTPVWPRELPAGGWRSTLEHLVAGGEADRAEVVITSVSAEIDDPSPAARSALEDLALVVQTDRRGHLIVLNASSLVKEQGAEGQPMDLRIRRLNLAALEASHGTGLSILDADRLIAESPDLGKVQGRFDYAPHICEALQASLVSILDDLGIATRPVMEVRLPFVRQARELTVERWLPSVGDTVSNGDVLCELRLRGLVRMSRPTSAVVLASINGKRSLGSLGRRERVRRRSREALLSLVALEDGKLRRVLQPQGRSVRPGEGLALLTSDAETPLEEPGGRHPPFRAALRTDDPLFEQLL